MKRLLLVLSCPLILAGVVAAQTANLSQRVDRGVLLAGTVFDQNGSVIASGQVIARSTGAKEYRATTNHAGIYGILLPVDVYKIEVNAPGFCPKRIEMLRIHGSRMMVQWPLDFVMEVAEEDRPCKQKTMINPTPPRRIRQPELFRSIAE